jgi:hypothetical protein
MATPNFRPLLDRLLDRGFATVTAATIAAIVAGVRQGRMASQLDQLDAEAERLESEGQRFSADDAVLAGVLASLADVALRNRALIDGAAVTVQEQGIAAAAQAARQMSLPGITDQALAAVGVTWRRVDPAVIAQAIQFASSEAFEASLIRYGEYIPQTVRDIAIRGITAGRGPIAIARDVRAAVDTLPLHHANSMLRSLQLNSMRHAQALNYAANRDIITEVVRVAALDGRTCVACILAHGTVLEPGEVVTGHRGCRCTSVARIRGLERLTQFESGVDYFERQPEAFQRSTLGGARYDAWKAGRTQLTDYMRHADDPVYGRVLSEASLVSVLGADAKDFYAR